MAVTNREELREYCLTKLGEPVIQINVSDEQVNDRIDDALQFFAEYHFDGVEKTYLRHVVTDAEFNYGQTSGVLVLPIPDNVLAVTKIFSLNDTFTENFFDAKYQMVLSDITNWGSLDLIGYDVTRRWYDLMSHMLDPPPRYEFNYVKNKIDIFVQGNDGFYQNSNVLIEAYAILNPDTYPKIWNDRYLKMYAAALIKQQWGANLSKYGAIQMPGGVELRGGDIYNEATQEVKEIEEQMELRYSEPPDFMIG